MAIAFDAVSSSNASGTSVSFSHTVTGSNTILIAAVSAASNSGVTSFGTPTYNGVSMTLLRSVNLGDNVRQIALFYLINPAAGANTFSASFSPAGTSPGISAFTLSYTGVSQTAPDSSNGGAEANTTVLASTTVIKSGCWLIGGIYVSGGAIGINTGIQRGSTISTDRLVSDSNGIVSAGTQSLSYSDSNGSTVGWVIASIAPSSPTNTNFFLMFN